MDEVQIVTYSAENHSAVRRLFSDGMLEQRKAAVFAGLSSTKLQALLLSVFLLGYFCNSAWLGIGSMFIVMVLQAYMVCWCFNTYVRYVYLHILFSFDHSVRPPSQFLGMTSLIT